jgi:hypothetical protein
MPYKWGFWFWIIMIVGSFILFWLVYEWVRPKGG